MSYSHLTMDERNVIYRMRFQGYSNAEIARCLGCHRSTIGRECKRNADLEGRYDPGRPNPGQQPKAGPSASAQDRPSPPDGLRRRAAGGRWSPEQIAGRRPTVPRRTWRTVHQPYDDLSLDLGAIPSERSSSVPSCGSPENPVANPTASPPAGARFSANDPSTNVPTKPTNEPAWAIGKAIPWSGKATRGFVVTCVDRASRYLIARKVEPVPRSR